MGLLKLLGMCASMFLGAYVCGEVPLRCTMNQRTMKYVTTVGVGLLIGVSFIVIIPEGVHTYYGAGQQPKQMTAAGALTLNSTAAAAASALFDPSHAAEAHDHAHEARSSDAHEHEHEGEAGHVEGAAHSHAHEEGEAGSAHGHAHSHVDCVDLSRSSSSVGAALVLGFVVMFLVDRIGGSEGHGHGHGGDGESQAADPHAHAHAHRSLTSHLPTHPSAGPNHSDGLTVSASASSNDQHARDGSADVDTDVEHPDPHADEQKQLLTRSAPMRTPSPAAAANQHQHQLPPLPEFDQTATIGILVHSAIDGLALGAISVSDNSSLELVVFAAIILHKAPAAFGLSSFLLHQGRDRSEVRKHLLYFSSAAPLTSLLTYVSFSYYNALAAGGDYTLSASSPDGQALLGLCLLFSAGTFLFTIAAHILPEIQPTPHSKSQPSMLLALIFGILAPLLFSSHNHGH